MLISSVLNLVRGANERLPNMVLAEIYFGGFVKGEIGFF